MIQKLQWKRADGQDRSRFFAIVVDKLLVRSIIVHEWCESLAKTTRTLTCCARERLLVYGTASAAAAAVAATDGYDVTGLVPRSLGRPQRRRYLPSGRRRPSHRSPGGECEKDGQIESRPLAHSPARPPHSPTFHFQPPTPARHRSAPRPVIEYVFYFRHRRRRPVDMTGW